MHLHKKMTLMLKVTQNVAQYTQHHVTFASTKVEAAMPNSLGEE